MLDELGLWIRSQTGERLLDITDHATGRFGTIWKRLGVLFGWSRCYANQCRGDDGYSYWRLSCADGNPTIVFEGGWSKVPVHASFDDIFEVFINGIFIVCNDTRSTHLSLSGIQLFQMHPEFANLKSITYSELEVKLSLMGV